METNVIDKMQQARRVHIARAVLGTLERVDKRRMHMAMQVTGHSSIRLQPLGLKISCNNKRRTEYNLSKTEGKIRRRQIFLPSKLFFFFKVLKRIRTSKTQGIIRHA
jgi:hypothetical protein